jgi:hypothetical protein
MGRLSTRLSVCGDTTIDDPSDEQIRGALSGLDASTGGAFVILSVDEQTYVQASGDSLIGFDLEYQVGSTDVHFRAQRDDIPMHEILDALTAYRDGVPDWGARFEFKRIPC